MTVRFIAEPCPQQDKQRTALVALAEHIDSRNGRHRSIEIRSHLREQGKSPLVVSVVFLKPRSYAMYVCDGTLGRPISFVSSGKMALYDPITDTLLYSPDAVVNWSLGRRDSRLRYAVYCVGSKEGGDAIDLDVRSFFEGATTDLETWPTGQDRYRIVRTSLLGDSVEALIDTRRSCPFTRLEFFQKGRASPDICLDRIRVDEDLDPANFSFPDSKTLEGSFRVVVSTDGGITSARAMATINKVSRARAALQNPTTKGMAETGDLKDVDWRSVERIDSKSSARLRELFRWPIIGEPPRGPG
jgi:hypothetical protein